MNNVIYVINALDFSISFAIFLLCSFFQKKNQQTWYIYKYIVKYKTFYYVQYNTVYVDVCLW